MNEGIYMLRWSERLDLILQKNFLKSKSGFSFKNDKKEDKKRRKRELKNMELTYQY